jgi:hypothetical protein
MTITIKDPPTERLLADAREPVEVCDSSGRTLGTFTPTRTAEDELYERVMRQIDPAEIARRKRESANEPVYTSEEVRAHLASLDRDPG